MTHGIEAWGSRDPAPGSSLVKDGSREHMAALVERGLLRLTPASRYNDPSLNPAVRDSELEFATHSPPGTRLQVEREPGSGVFVDIPGTIGLLTNTRKSEDFYVFCASGAFDPRAFDDEFGPEYDACILVRDWPVHRSSYVPYQLRESASGLLAIQALTSDV